MNCEFEEGLRIVNFAGWYMIKKNICLNKNTVNKFTLKI